MNRSVSRRRLMQAAPLALPLSTVAAAPALAPSALEVFPAQPAELAGEMVTVAHGNFKRVKELAEAHPSLVKASWDRGFGDWETALGAASHTGHRDIAGDTVGECNVREAGHQLVLQIGVAVRLSE